MNTITELPGVQIEAPRRAGVAVVTPIETAGSSRRGTGRGVWILLAACGLLVAGMLVARVLLPAVDTVTSTSSQGYQQAP